MGEELGSVMTLFPVRIHDVSQVVEEVHGVGPGQIIGHGRRHVALGMPVSPAARVADAVETQCLAAFNGAQRVLVQNVAEHAPVWRRPMRLGQRRKAGTGRDRPTLENLRQRTPSRIRQCGHGVRRLQASRHGHDPF
jgi:hypothetical protein